ncbi:MULTISPECIES: ATP-binding protein [Pirellulaceae]|nr:MULTISPECIES: ATP-binding protein [Pirellulaceae]
MNTQRNTHRAKGLSVSAKISLGFLIVLLLHVSIAALSHYGMAKSQSDLKTYSELFREVEQLHEIDQTVGSLQQNVMLFAFTGYEGPERRAQELQDKLGQIISEATTFKYLDNRDDIYAMQQHLSTHREILAAVEVDRAKRRKLVNDVLQRHANEFQVGILALLENPSTRIMAEEADAAFTTAQLNLLKYVNTPDSTYFREAKSQLSLTKSHLEQIETLDGLDSQKAVEQTIVAINLYENAAIQMVQATRGYLHLVNVVLAGESVEFRRLAREIRSNQIEHVRVLAETMMNDNRHFQYASNVFSIITIVLGIVAAWLIGRNVVPPLNAIASTFDRLTSGEKINAIPALDRHDELGRLAMAAQVFRNKAAETERLLDVAENAREELNFVNDELAKQSELARRMAEDATAATAAKSEFLANMSHEIRTPMTAILGFAETVADDTKDEETKQAIETIQRNGHHLLSIINDILDLSKVESGKMTVESISTCPYTLITDVISLVKVKADGAGLQITSNFIGKIPKEISTDPTRLRQILINVLGNAIKFTEVGGVTLRSEFVQEGDRAMMQFDVIDTGIGMSDHQISNLFQPFTQADSSTTRRFGGTGLGLTISKRLANMLGGDLTITYSRMGEGSAFRLTIDAGAIEDIEYHDSSTLRSLMKTKSPDSKSAHRLHGVRLLLAEDGPDNQRLLKHILSKAGAEVDIVDNGQLAAERAMQAWRHGTPYDCILMDMQMPIKDGYEATRELRRLGYNAPILALTAHAMSSDEKKCKSVGCDGFLTKPIDRKLLLTTVRHWTNAAEYRELS